MQINNDCGGSDVHAERTHNADILEEKCRIGRNGELLEEGFMAGVNNVLPEEESRSGAQDPAFKKGLPAGAQVKGTQEGYEIASVDDNDDHVEKSCNADAFEEGFRSGMQNELSKGTR